MAPDRKVAAAVDAGNVSRGAHGINDCARLAVADEIGMRPCGPEARIVGRRDDDPLLDQLPQSRHLLENKNRKRRRAMRHDAGGGMRPGNDPPAAGRRKARRHDDHAGHRDAFAVETGRAIEHAVGLRAGWRKRHRLGTDDRARRAGQFLHRCLVERRLRMSRTGREPECQGAQQRAGTASRARHGNFHLSYLWRSHHRILSIGSRFQVAAGTRLFG